MRVSVGGDDIQIPESCIAGLADVRAVILGRSSEDSTFSMEGGETGERYEAVFVVVGNRIVRRRVASKIFPDEAWEETRYAYNDNEG